MNIAILGRQPELGIAELERLYGYKNINLITKQVVSVDSEVIDVQKLGGSPKVGVIIEELSKFNNWKSLSSRLIDYYHQKWSRLDNKITLGLSVYNYKISPKEVQKIGLGLKQKLKKDSVSLRLIPNQTPALSSATSHHNKLGLSANKVEIFIVLGSNDEFVIAESRGAQNITAYSKRDYDRPKRDSFVGMLPPKLAQIMINLAAGDIVKDSKPQDLTLLDPFCGTGTMLQEALLMGYNAYGTDLSEKMISYTRDNLKWLSDISHKDFKIKLAVADATNYRWQRPIDIVVCESYLGQPFSTPPSQSKLAEVVGNCNYIISEFLLNLHPQIDNDAAVCIAIPTWRDSKGDFTHLPLIETIARLGYRPYEFHNVSKNDMVYFRENQIVAREILVLKKI